jgi:cysteine desulfurase/selenocysteine lyase
VRPPISRDHFALDPELTYLNHASIGLLPIAAREALVEFATRQAERGLLGILPYEKALPEYRARLAQFVGARPEEVAFLSNASHAANVLARGMDWESGDEVIINDNEFGSNALPWLALREQGVRIRMVETTRERMTPDVLARMMTPRTRLVATSWVSFTDGYRHDLAALAEVTHRCGASLVVDVIQGLGAFPCDMHAWGVDAIFGGAQKWLLAQPGLGFLCLRAEFLGQIRVRLPGWRSVERIWNFLDYDQPLEASAARYEGGTPNLSGIASLVASLDVLDTASARERAEHILALTDYLVEALLREGAEVHSQRSAGSSSGIVTFSLRGGDPSLLGDRCAAAGVVVTARPNGIRVSPHAYSTHEEIDRLLEVVGRG